MMQASIPPVPAILAPAYNPLEGEGFSAKLTKVDLEGAKGPKTCLL
jgi:hypothetical protein